MNMPYLSLYLNRTLSRRRKTVMESLRTGRVAVTSRCKGNNNRSIGRSIWYDA